MIFCVDFPRSGLSRARQTRRYGPPLSVVYPLLTLWWSTTTAVHRERSLCCSGAAGWDDALSSYIKWERDSQQFTSEAQLPRSWAEANRKTTAPIRKSWTVGGLSSSRSWYTTTIIWRGRVPAGLPAGSLAVNYLRVRFFYGHEKPTGRQWWLFRGQNGSLERGGLKIEA